jgi:predicted PurR-regulated permease PerM
MSHEAKMSAATLEQKTLRVCLAVLVLCVILLLLPFWPWLFLALWTAGLGAAPFRRLTRAIGGRSRAAAAATMGLLLIIVVPLGAGIAVVAPDLLHLAQTALASTSGRGALVELVSNGDTAQLDTKKVLEMVQAHGKQAFTVAALLASSLGVFALGIVIYFVSTYAALVHGDTAYEWLRERLPLAGQQVDRLRDTYHETGRGLLFSVDLTALGQAALATIAYVSLGVPRPFALGLLTFITSVIPAVGPFLVWGPVALGLLLAGHPAEAAILTGVCALIVAPADNLLRPLFAKWGQLKLHPFLVLLSMLAGVVMLGGWGLMLGPLTFRMALEILEMARETRSPREQQHGVHAPSGAVGPPLGAE